MLAVSFVLINLNFNIFFRSKGQNNPQNDDTLFNIKKLKVRQATSGYSKEAKMNCALEKYNY